MVCYFCSFKLKMSVIAMVHALYNEIFNKKTGELQPETRLVVKKKAISYKKLLLQLPIQDKNSAIVQWIVHEARNCVIHHGIEEESKAVMTWRHRFEVEHFNCTGDVDMEALLKRQAKERQQNPKEEKLLSAHDAVHHSRTRTRDE